MSYTKTNWENGATPAINADNLNKIEQGIYDATENFDNYYTKTAADAKFRTISDSYSKGDFKVITFEKTLGIRATETYTESLSSYIDDAEKYALISAGMYVVKGTPPVTGSSQVNKWLYSFVSESYVTVDGTSVINDINIYGGPVRIYNDDGVPKAYFKLYNVSDYQRTVKLRLVLLKIA